MAKSVTRRKSRASSRPSMRMMGLSAAVVAVALTSGVTWVLPAVHTLSDVNAQVTSAQHQIAATQSRIAALKGGASGDAQSLLTQARALDAQLPTAVDKVGLAASVPQSAAGFGLTVTQMDPGTTATISGSVSALSFTMGVKGDYAQVENFLASLTTSTTSGALMGVQDLNVKVAAGVATASFTLQAYYSSVAPLPITSRTPSHRSTTSPPAAPAKS